MVNGCFLGYLADLPTFTGNRCNRIKFSRLLCVGGKCLIFAPLTMHLPRRGPLESHGQEQRMNYQWLEVPTALKKDC